MRRVWGQIIQQTKTAKSYFKEVQTKLEQQGIQVSTTIMQGPPVEAIVAVAARENVDMIAIVSHGRSGLDRVFYGSMGRRYPATGGSPPACYPHRAVNRLGAPFSMLYFLSMNMPMVNVWPMHMCMVYRLMSMGMVMLSAIFFFVMLMRMVLVMFMGMRMGEPFMMVVMPMHFPVEEEHPKKHERRRHPVRTRWALTKNDDGEDGANERSRCEPGTRSCRSYFPQGMNEEDKAYSVAERSDNEGSRDLKCRDRTPEQDDEKNDVEYSGYPALHAGQKRGGNGLQFTG